MNLNLKPIRRGGYYIVATKNNLLDHAPKEKRDEYAVAFGLEEFAEGYGRGFIKGLVKSMGSRFVLERSYRVPANQSVQYVHVFRGVKQPSYMDVVVFKYGRKSSTSLVVHLMLNSDGDDVKPILLHPVAQKVLKKQGIVLGRGQADNLLLVEEGE